MENPEKLATFGTQDTRRRQKNCEHLEDTCFFLKVMVPTHGNIGYTRRRQKTVNIWNIHFS
jgi:hypothetical protein